MATPKIVMTTKKGDQPENKNDPKNAEYQKIKITKKMKKTNKVTPKIEDSSKINTYLYCHTICDFFP